MPTPVGIAQWSRCGDMVDFDMTLNFDMALN